MKWRIRAVACETAESVLVCLCSFIKVDSDPLEKTKEKIKQINSTAETYPTIHSNVDMGNILAIKCVRLSAKMLKQLDAGMNG
jgi:hypothetical protein